MRRPGRNAASAGGAHHASATLYCPHRACDRVGCCRLTIFANDHDLVLLLLRELLLELLVRLLLTRLLLLKRFNVREDERFKILQPCEGDRREF